MSSVKWVCKLNVYMQCSLISVFGSSDASPYKYLTHAHAHTHTHTHTHKHTHILSYLKMVHASLCLWLFSTILNVRLRDTELYNVPLGAERKTNWNSECNVYPTLWHIKGCTKCVLLTGCMHFTTNSRRSPTYSQRIPYCLPGNY